MRAIAAIALATTALFMLPGCGEAEKAKEKLERDQVIRNQVQAEVSAQVQERLSAMLPGEIQNQLRIMEEHKKQQAELEKQQAAQLAAEKAQAGQSATKSSKSSKPTSTSTKKKKPANP